MIDTSEGLCYTMTYKGADRSSRPITDHEKQIHSIPLNYVFSALSFAVISNTSCSQVHLVAKCNESLGSLINAWNAPMIFEGKHTVYMAATSDTDNVLLYNLDIMSSVDIYVEGWHVTTIAQDSCVTMPLSTLSLRSYVSKAQQTLVLANAPLLDITTYIVNKCTQECNGYKETLYLPCGSYGDLNRIVAALNAQIQLRGSNGGYIYIFSIHNRRIVIQVVQNYPKGSMLDVIPCNHALGLFKQTQVPLRSSKRIECASCVQHLIM